MEFSTMKRVVIITENVIKDELLKLIMSLGAKGYTIANVSGRGARGLRDDNADTLVGEHLRNIKVEVITREDIAKKITVSVLEKFFKNYAGIAYMDDVEVLKGEKF